MSSPTSYIGFDNELAMNPENLPELYESLDCLHTMVMDNMGGDHPALEVLSESMEKIYELMAEEEQDSII